MARDGKTPAIPGDRPARRRSTLVLLSAGALLLISVYASMFTVDVTQYGVVSRFGRILRVIDTPGFHFKLPFDRVLRIDRRLLYSKPAEAEYLTSDKKNVVVRTLAVWRIADPKRFLETVRNRSSAEVQLADVVLAEVGAALGNYPFASFVSVTTDGSRFEDLVSEVQDAVRTYALPAFGIEVIDLYFRQLYLPEANKASVFERMKAERGKIAKLFRSEGERDANRMIAEADREKARIDAQAYEEVARSRAAGDAEAMQIYADAFIHDSAFYKFLHTLEAYRALLDDRTTLFLPADSELLAILQGDGGPAERRAVDPDAPVASDDRDGRPRAEASDVRAAPASPEAVP
jgi:modulator of FtsH protease HflC